MKAVSGPFLLPDNPRQTQLVLTVGSTGHTDISMMIEQNLDDKFQSFQAAEEKVNILMVTRRSTNDNCSDGNHKPLDAWVTLVTTPDYG